MRKPDDQDCVDRTGNLRLLRYITTQLAADPRKWGEIKSYDHRRSVEILAAYKDAWVLDVRESGTADPDTGELRRADLAEQNRMWDGTMQRAEQDIREFLARKVA